MSTVTISDKVKNILSRCEVDGNKLVIKDNLDRGVYIEVNKILSIAGGKWDRKLKAHVFPKPVRETGLFDACQIAKEKIYDKKKDLQQFFTPQWLANRLVLDAGITPGMTVLEPSAGTGTLANAARAIGADVCCIELDPELAEGLRQQNFPVVEGDFLAQTNLDAGFDRVIMNPPFDRNLHIEHVYHALREVKCPVFAVMGAGFITSKFRTARILHGQMVDYAHLPDNAFKESGTSVNMVFVHFSPF